MILASTYAEGEVFKKAGVLLEFLTEVIHCNSLVSILHLWFMIKSWGGEVQNIFSSSVVQGLFTQPVTMNDEGKGSQYYKRGEG